MLLSLSAQYLIVSIHFFIIAAFSNSPFIDKKSSSVKVFHLPTCPDDKAEILTVACLNSI